MAADLKQARASAKAAVTKAKSELESALLGGKEQELQGHAERLKDKLAAFKAAHHEYVGTLADGEDVDREREYYGNVASSAQELLDKLPRPEISGKSLRVMVKRLREEYKIEVAERKVALQRKVFELKSQFDDQDDNVSDVESETDEPSRAPSVSISSEQSLILQTQKQMMDLMAAPKLEIPAFDGSPLRYFPFVRAFEDNVEKVVADPASRLARLNQYTTGPANNLIQCCLMMSPSEGYKRAREMLANRFGNSYTISQTVIEQATNGPVIKGDRALQAFSDDLRNSYEMLKAMDCLEELNVQTNLLKITKRLPSFVQTRWRKEASQIRREEDRRPNLHDLLTVIEIAADEANDPVFGTASQTSSSSSHKQPQGASSFSTQASTSLKCQSCGADHRMHDCAQFLAMTPPERKEHVRMKELCYNCLSAKHAVSRCQSQRTCFKCGQKHHTLIHQSVDLQSAYVGDGHGAGSNRIALPVVAVMVKTSEGRAHNTYALLDSGSTSTFIAKSLMTKLRAKGEQCQVSLTTLDKTSAPEWMTACAIQVSDADGSEFMSIPRAFCRDTLPIKEANIATVDDINEWPHLRGIHLPTATGAQVELLIGQDSPDCLVPLHVIPGKRDEPYAIRTKLGWALSGPVGGSHPGPASVTSAHASLEEQVERFWRIDSPDVYSTKVEMSSDDHGVLRKWDAEITKEGPHYQLPIPFKEPTKMRDNRCLAESRLKSLAKKLRNSPTHDQYTAEMTELIENGYAEEVSENTSAPDKVWYLPHHAVTNPNKKKLRIVFDCAASFHGTSLNDNVFQGPDFTNKLTGVLLRFRHNKVAFMADIKTMYYQVKVSPANRDHLRFLWYPEGDLDKPPKVYRMTVHPFGGCWSPSCCTYALQRSADDVPCSELTREVIRECFYVDDCLCTSPSVETAKELASELRDVLKQAGFTLTKWTANNVEFLSSVPEADRAASVRNLDLEMPSIERALGVIWDTKRDSLTFKISLPTKPMTKRGVLSVLSSVYDPLGLISPFILQARRIVQELFRREIDWDEPMPEDLQQHWNAWLEQVNNIEEFAVPRCISVQGEEREIHYFSDASEKAYGVAAYLRTTQSDGTVRTELLMAKSRLAPLKGMTIPRLELSAAALAAQLDEHVRHELKLTKEASYFWTDSSIVLGYLRNRSTRYKTFVSNRVRQIQELTDVEHWRHVPTHLNPADDCSRGTSASDLIQNDRWLHGPAYLARPRAEWPEDATTNRDDADPEVKIVTTLCGGASHVHPADKLLSAFSSWTRVKRATAWILLVKDVLCKRRTPRARLETEDLAAAERVLLQHEQQSIPIDKRTTKTLQGLNALPDQHGLLRAHGRLAKSPIPEHMRRPIILPRSRAAELIIREKHATHGHVGREFTLSLVMTAYWIIGARRIVKDVIKRCITCSKIRQTPEQPQMADLPEDRVTPGTHAFASVGCDYFGPFQVKRGRGREKRYGCVFTCLNTRAVHLEVSPALDTSAFVNCLTRFIARRGKPDLIRSDNGTNFVGAERELREEVQRLNTEGLHKHMADAGIKWIFNPPGASHMGGAWERQIRSVRKILAGLTHEQILTDDALVTLMCSVEATLNNRPLTVISTDPNDLEPLTPNHLLILRAAASVPGEFSSADLYCRSRWRQVQYLVKLFWTRWLKEYLPQLQRRSKWLWEKKNLAVGDVVLIIDNSAPQNSWTLGRVLETLPGSDGMVRSVKLKTKDSELVRPVHKLCKLECEPEQESEANKVDH